jgi:hypothetical protein
MNSIGGKCLKPVHDQPQGGGPDKEPDNVADVEMVAPIDGEHEHHGGNEAAKNAFSPNIQTQKIHVNLEKGLRRIATLLL